MREGRGASKCELESRFEKKAAEDHEVVPITVLRLHDSNTLDLGGGHPDRVVWFARRGIWILDLLAEYMEVV